MSRARRCGTWLAGTLPRLGGRIAGAGAVAVLVTGMLTPAALAAVGSGAVGPTREPVSDGPVGRDVGTFRVDVSRFPQIGVVVTVPGPVQGLQRSDFRVLSGREAQVPSVRRLSADDIEVMLAPDADGASARLYPQWAAAARFLAGLPAGARTGMADPSGAALVASPLSMDPARSVTDIANLAPAPGPVPAAARLAASLSAFSRGSRVRRTVVLAITRNESLSRAAAARFRQQLAASGTALYVLDAAPRAAAGYDALASGSGGSAIRIRRAADWPLAFGQITDDLNRQYYLRFPAGRPCPATPSSWSGPPLVWCRASQTCPPPTRSRPRRSGHWSPSCRAVGTARSSGWPPC